MQTEIKRIYTVVRRIKRKQIEISESKEKVRNLISSLIFISNICCETSNFVSGKEPFRVLIISKNVDKINGNIEYICVDSTYKLNHLGFPIIVIGTVNRNGKFILLALGSVEFEKACDFVGIFEKLKEMLKYNDRLFNQNIQWVILQLKFPRP